MALEKIKRFNYSKILYVYILRLQHFSINSNHAGFYQFISINNRDFYSGCVIKTWFLTQIKIMLAFEEFNIKTDLCGKFIKTRIFLLMDSQYICFYVKLYLCI